MKSIIIKTIKITLPLGLGFFLLWYFFHQMDKQQLKQFYTIIFSANYVWVALSLVLSFLAYLIRAERWKLTLEAMNYKTQFKNRYHSLMIGYIINMTIPRAGEVSRAGMLYRSEKVPFSNGFGTVISERVVDLCFLMLIAFITYLLNLGQFSILFQRIKTAFGIQEDGHLKLYLYGSFALICIVLMILYFVNLKFRTKIKAFISGVLSGLLSIFHLKKQWLFWFYSMLIWALYISYFSVCFFSIKESSDVTIAGVMLAFIAGSLGVTFTNGGIGAFPLLIGIVFEMISNNPDALVVGNALGMLIWASQTLLVIILGIISLISISKPYGKESLQ